MHFLSRGRLLLCWAFLAGIAAAPVHAQPPSADHATQNGDQKLEADILLGAARNALSRGDLDAALQRFEEFRKRFPDRDDVRREYADALFGAGRVREALPEYDRILEQNADNPQFLRTYVDALLRVGDHPRAKQLLTEGVGRFSDRVDFAASLALLHALDGETAAADELIRTRIHGRDLSDDRTRVDAAALYVQLGRPDDAAPILDGLLKNDPNDARVLGLSVRYALLIGDNSMAVQQLEKLDGLFPGNVALRLELASALYAADDYSEAGRLFEDVLRRLPNDATALIGCARVAMRDDRMDAADQFLEQVPSDLRNRQWLLAVSERDTIVGDYDDGHRILARLIDDNPDDRQAMMALADLNRAQNEFIKADAIYAALGAGKNNSAADLHLAMSLYLQRRYGRAEQICRYLVAGDPANAEANVLLARILMKTCRATEAAECLRQAQAASRHALPECLYFSQFCPSVPAPDAADESRPIFTAAALFDLAMEDGRRDWAKQVLEQALAIDPENILLRTRLAEWHASFGVPCEASRAAEIYRELLARQPCNQKWMLGLARAYVTMRCNAEAMALYQKLRCQSPANYLYARETARVVFFVCGSPQGLAEYDSEICHWTGLKEEACRLAIERRAKAAHYSQPSVASHDYERLLALEPYEQHLAFELGQAQGSLGETTNAIGAYEDLLAGSPNHRDAQVALEGKQLEQCPVVAADTRFVRERGRDGLTSIDRFGEYVSYQFARLEENEHLSLGYGRLTLAPTYGQGTAGNALTFRYQKQVDGLCRSLLSPYTPMAFFVDGELQQFDRFVSTRPDFEAGVRIRSFDDLVWTVSGTMDNVLENGESLLQDIYRGGLRTDLDFMPCNDWRTEATFSMQAYSDDNTRYAAEFRNWLQLTPDPRRLTLLLNGYYWNFAEASVFSPGPDPYRDMVHPYWTPINYWMGDVGLEYKRWLSWDRFDGAQHCWVSFSVVKRWDNQRQNYMVYRGTLNWDITRRLSGYALSEYDEGSPYRGTWAYGGLALKL